MPEATNDLIYEVLRQLQAGISEVKGTLQDHTQMLIKIREEIHTLRGDDLRREAMQAQMDFRLERMESRLNLRDA